MDPLESPIGEFGPQMGFHLRSGEQCIRELVEHDFGESQVVGDVGWKRDENGQHAERRFGAQGSESEQQTSFAKAPVAKDGERRGSACLHAVL
jgi:hypothetical protein